MFITFWIKIYETIGFYTDLVMVLKDTKQLLKEAKEAIKNKDYKTSLKLCKVSWICILIGKVIIEDVFCNVR